MPAQAGVMLKPKPVIIFSIRSQVQGKPMPAQAGLMPALKPEIMGYSAAKWPEKAKENFSMRGGQASPQAQ